MINCNHDYNQVEQLLTKCEAIPFISEERSEKSHKIAALKDPASLPNVFSKVLSHLNSKEIASSRLVSKTWSQGALTTDILHETELLKPYFELLNLDPAEGNPILASKTLTELQKNLLALRERVVRLVKESHVNDLKKLKPPLFFDKILDLAPVYKDINAAKNLFGAEKSKKISHCISALCKLECLEKSIELAQSLNDDEVLTDVCLEVALAGKFTEAIKLAKTMHNKISKLLALQNIAFEAGSQKQWDLAKNLANSISDIGIRKNILLDLTSKLCNAGEFWQAELMTYNLIVPEEVRFEARREIFAASRLSQ